MRMFILVILVGFLSLSCGKDASWSPTNAGPDTTDSTSVPTDSIPPVKPGSTPSDTTPVSRLATIPESDYTEIINFLVNKDFADIHPELNGNVAQIVTDVNAMLEKSGIKKRYVLGKVMIYPDADALYEISTNPVYFTDNNFIGNPYYGGTTIVYWAQPSNKWPPLGEIPKFFHDMGNATFASRTTISGKDYGLIFLTENAASTSLLGKSNLNNYSGEYAARLMSIEHELGHTIECGLPEWYSLVCSDNSGTLPRLDYDHPILYPEDPMSVENWIESKFSPFNAWLFNNNANHQALNMHYAQRIGIQVKVIDSESNPVPNAIITAYGGVSDGNVSRPDIGIARNMETVIKTVNTGTDGTVYSFIPTAGWFVIGVKVSCNGVYAGKVVTSVDLEDAYFRCGLDRYTLTLVLPSDVIMAVEE